METNNYGSQGVDFFRNSEVAGVFIHMNCISIMYNSFRNIEKLKTTVNISRV